LPINIKRSSPNGGLFWNFKMPKYIKNNLPIIILLIIVVGGFGYPFYSGEWITPPRLAESDAKCYGINVPEDIDYKQTELFCSCMRMSKIEDNKEKSQYCANQVSR